MLNPIRLLRRYVKGHHISRAALVASGIVAALVFFVIGAGVRLLIGPVSLGPFAGTLADALDRALPGITVKYDQAAIEWEQDEGKVNLVILGTRVFDVDGRIIAQAPKADIDLSATPFLKGKIVVRRIVLVGVQLTLVRTPDGGLRLGVEKDRQERDILQRISDALKANNGSTSSLESFAVRRARLALLDESTGLFVVAPRADFRLSRVGDHLAAKVDADVEISGRPAHVAADVEFPPSRDRVSGELSVRGFEVHSLADNSKTFAAVKDTALKLDLTGSFVFQDARLASAAFKLSAKGSYAIPEIKDGRLRVNMIRASGQYDGTDRRITFEDAAIDSDKIDAHLRGRLIFVPDAAGGLAGLKADLRINQLSLVWPSVFSGPVSFQFVDLRGAWDRPGRAFLIDHLAISGTPLSMQASGRIAMPTEQSPAVDVAGSVGPIGVRDLLGYWPLGAASGARGWVSGNMFAGMVGPTSFEVHLLPGMADQAAVPADAVTVKFAINGGEINYITGLTHLTEVKGTATATGNSFTADVSSAKIGPLALSGARFVVPDLYAADEAGNITGHIRGAMPDVLALVDLPPLHYATRFNVNAASSKGNAGLDVSFRVPLLKSVNVDDVAIGIKAAITDFAIALGPHTQLTDGTIAFAIDNAKLRANGTTGVGGSATRLNVDWNEDFKTAKATTTRIAVKGSLDELARDALGIKLKGFLKGPIGINGTLTGHRGSLSQGNLNFDFTPANVVFDMIGVNKPAGFPMTTRVTASFGPKSTLESQVIRITGPGTSVTANARYDASERLTLLQAPTVRIGPQNDFSLNLTRNEAGLDIAIRGHSIDGSRLARRGSGGDEDVLDEPYHLSAKLERLVLRDGIALAPFALDISGVADRPSAMTLSGFLSKTATVTGAIVTGDSGRRVTILTNDMGTLFHGLFSFNSMRGGKLEFAAMLPAKADQPPAADPSGPELQGKAILKDFRVMDQPFLARVFAAGSLGGLSNLLQGQGIAVDALEVPFSTHNGVISVHDVRATGPSIGITADGYIDRPKNDIALKGSLVPLFGINSVLGNIPLLGNVLTSKAGEGIIGMTYSVSGNADEPTVSVNPLSALAPGILRRIFEGRMPNAAQAPSNVPAPQGPPAPTTTPPEPLPNPAKPRPKSQ